MMADQSHIEWTDATWNIITGCTLVSEGCRHCYAAKLAATRLANPPSRKGLARQNAKGEYKFTGEVRFNEQWLDQPLRWKRPRKIFVCAHGDLFHEGVSDDWLDQVFAVMALCPQHVFQVLTKRPERMRAYFAGGALNRVWNAAVALDCQHHVANDEVGSFLLPADPKNPTWPLPNVWLGTSVEDQERADERIPVLLDTPAAVRWISAEPLLGPVDLQSIKIACPNDPADCCGGQAYDDVLNRTTTCRACEGPEVWNGPRLDWVVVGGESGAGARPMHPDWARSLRDQCKDAGVPFLFKQWGSNEPGELLDDGRDEPWRRWASGEENWALSEYGKPKDSLAKWKFSNVGKARAGRMLDGVEHNGYPVRP